MKSRKTRKSSKDGKWEIRKWGGAHNYICNYIHFCEVQTYFHPYITKLPNYFGNRLTKEGLKRLKFNRKKTKEGSRSDFHTSQELFNILKLKGSGNQRENGSGNRSGNIGNIFWLAGYTDFLLTLLRPRPKHPIPFQYYFPEHFTSDLSYSISQKIKGFCLTALQK